MMKIAGLNKTTLLDYPGHVAATVFLKGCNFRCPFCHNAGLVLNTRSDSSDASSYISEVDLFDFLTKRVNILEGVCITGGEPTINSDLPEFISKIKTLGLKIKLDTNGSNPDMLKALIDSKSLDYVAMDIKNSFEKYPLTVGAFKGINSSDETVIGNGAACVSNNVESADYDKFIIKNIRQSISLLLERRVDYEFRTTIVRELHTKDDMRQIDEAIAGASKYFIQSFVSSDNVIEKDSFSAYTKDELLDLISVMQNVTPVIRGVE